MDQPNPSSSSSSAEPPAAQSAPAAQAAASAPAIPSQAGQPTSERPAYVPESFWADGAVKGKEFGEYVDGLTARVAADDVRKLSLPKQATDYKVELPATFTPPQGVEFKLNEGDPLFAQAKEIALKRGFDQETFSELMGLYAGAQVSSQAEVKAARDAEISKLGTTGPARIDALTRFFKGYLGEAEGAQVMSRVFTASDVQVLERLTSKIASGGAGAFTASGREPPQAAGRVTNEEFAKMSAAERLDYTRKFDQSQFMKAH